MSSIIDIGDIAKQIEIDFGCKLDQSRLLVHDKGVEIIRISEDLCLKVSIPTHVRDFPEVLRHCRYLCIPIKTYFSDSGYEGSIQHYLNLYNLQCLIKRGVPMPESKAGRIVYCILKGLEVLHKNGFLHRDLHPENIMLHIEDGKLYAVIIDFDEMRALSPQTKACYRYNGYNAPEIVLTNAYYDERAEVFAVGVMFWELLFGVCPFAGYKFFGCYIENSWEVFMDNKDFFESKTKNAIKTISNSQHMLQQLSDDCACALWSLLAPNPLERESASCALSLPFFKQYSE